MKSGAASSQRLPAERQIYGTQKLFARSRPTSAPRAPNDVPRLDRNVRFTEGFRTAALCRRVGTGRGAGVRKPRKEETAGRKRRALAGRTYGDFRVADGSPMWRWGWRAAGVIVRSEHDALFRGRGCERRVWAQPAGESLRRS